MHNSNWWLFVKHKTSGADKTAAITHEVSGSLSNIFTPGTKTVRPDVLATIRKGINKIKAYLAEQHPEVKMSDYAEIVGAAVTYQYGPTSDIDTTLFINLPEQVPSPNPGERGKMIRNPVFKTIDKWVEANVDPLFTLDEAGTSRPFQFKLRPDTDMSKPRDNADASVDVNTGRFIKEPPSPEHARSERKRLIESGESPVQKDYKRLEEKIRGMVRSFYNVAKKAVSENEAEKYSKWLIPQAREIISAYETAKKNRQSAYSEKQNMPTGRISRNWADSNIVFKMLDNEGYMSFMKIIKEKIADGSFTVGELQEAISAAEKTDALTGSLGFNS